MSSILYYSNFCEHSKNLLQYLSKNSTSKDIHFICIDKRIKENGKMYIVLENGQKIIMPENVTKVPALLLLNQNYRVLTGNEIYSHFKQNIQESVKKSTQNNMEPMAFSFGNFSGGGMSGSGIVSDNFSFLDMGHEELSTKGEGGMRQMHSYVALNQGSDISMHLPQDEFGNDDKLGSIKIEDLQKQRDQDIANISYRNK